MVTKAANSVSDEARLSRYKNLSQVASADLASWLIVVNDSVISEKLAVTGEDGGEEEAGGSSRRE